MASAMKLACLATIWITLTVLVLLVEDAYIPSLPRIYRRVILSSRNLLLYSPSIVDDKGSFRLLFDDGDLSNYYNSQQVILIAVLRSALALDLVLLCCFCYRRYLKKKKPVASAAGRPLLATIPDADQLV